MMRSGLIRKLGNGLYSYMPLGLRALRKVENIIREELDAEIAVGDLLETVEWDYPNFHLTMHCFMCSLTSESIHLNEHEAAAWLTMETLHSVKWLPADEGILRKIEVLIS